MSLSGVSYDVDSEVVERETRGTVTATLEGETIGDLVFVDYSGTTQVTRIFVEPDYQREGVATAMVAALRDFFPASVPAQFFMNADARAFHDAIIDDYKRPTA